MKVQYQNTNVHLDLHTILRVSGLDSKKVYKHSFPISQGSEDHPLIFLFQLHHLLPCDCFFLSQVDHIFQRRIITEPILQAGILCLQRFFLFQQSGFGHDEGIRFVAVFILVFIICYLSGMLILLERLAQRNRFLLYKCLESMHKL